MKTALLVILIVTIVVILLFFLAVIIDDTKTFCKVLRALYDAILRGLIVASLLASVYLLYRTCVCKGVTLFDKETAAITKN